MSDRFRKNYTTLTDEQKALGLAIKEKAEELAALYEKMRRKRSDWSVASDESSMHIHETNGCLSHAHTRLEESVMWAVKGAYTEIPQ